MFWLIILSPFCFGSLFLKGLGLGIMVKKSKGYPPAKIQQAGIHLILDLWGAQNLNSMSKIKKLLTESVKACGATLLKTELHQFSPQGISGIAVIAESHISIHTWPEKGYAAMDIFTCGKVDPYRALVIIKKILQPERVEMIEIKRGINL